MGHEHKIKEKSVFSTRKTQKIHQTLRQKKQTILGPPLLPPVSP
jgi:hypothetical protein